MYKNIFVGKFPKDVQKRFNNYVDLIELYYREKNADPEVSQALKNTEIPIIKSLPRDLSVSLWILVDDTFIKCHPVELDPKGIRKLG